MPLKSLKYSKAGLLEAAWATGLVHPQLEEALGVEVRACVFPSLAFPFSLLTGRHDASSSPLLCPPNMDQKHRVKIDLSSKLWISGLMSQQ